MSNWLNKKQAIGRVLRPTNELTVEVDIRGSRKKLIVDLESDNFKVRRETFCTHYAEYRDFDTCGTYWKRFSLVPRTKDLYTARTVIRHNEDGTYEYVKNKASDDKSLRLVPEELMMWIILKAEV